MSIIDYDPEDDGSISLSGQDGDRQVLFDDFADWGLGPIIEPDEDPR